MKLPAPLEFQLDKGNANKSLHKHGVTKDEAEEIFFDPHGKTFPDHVHSGKEERYRIVGKTIHGRLLFCVFTIRENKIRVISARDLNLKEHKLYYI